MVMIELSSVDVAYDGTVVLKGLDLQVARGEFLTLLGPSGCGKSTLLRAIAGFVTPVAGTVSIDGDVVSGVPPERRPVGIVFQGYALFPHLSVASNVEFGLKTRHIPSAERRQRVASTLTAFGLEDFAPRSPADLSGGQQQRVAIARALVNETPVLLMDEPLSNLDAALRVRLREEIRSIHRDRGITTIFVTHDQEEALSLSDRIAVLLDGEIAQLGTPDEVYHQPKSVEVCTFIGRANALPNPTLQAFGLPSDTTHRAAYVRPERVAIGAAADGSPHAASGRIVRTDFIGPNRDVTVEVAGQQIVCSVASSHRDNYRDGDSIVCGLRADDVIWIDQ